MSWFELHGFCEFVTSPSLEQSYENLHTTLAFLIDLRLRVHLDVHYILVVYSDQWNKCDMHILHARMYIEGFLS